MATKRQVEFPKRLQPAALDTALCSEVARKPDEFKDTVMIGTMIGIARGVSYRANPQDPSRPSIALVGVFEGIPANPELPLLRSSAAFLPGAVHDQIVAAIMGDGAAPDQIPARGQKIDVIGNEMKIAFEIGVKKSKVKGGAGYEFVTRALAEISLADPLAQLKAEIGGAALEDHSEGKRKGKK